MTFDVLYSFTNGHQMTDSILSTNTHKDDWWRYDSGVLSAFYLADQLRTVRLASTEGIEMHGTKLADILTGTDGDDSLYGEGGRDRLSGEKATITWMEALALTPWPGGWGTTPMSLMTKMTKSMNSQTKAPIPLKALRVITH